MKIAASRLALQHNGPAFNLNANQNKTIQDLWINWWLKLFNSDSILTQLQQMLPSYSCVLISFSSPWQNTWGQHLNKERCSLLDSSVQTHDPLTPLLLPCDDEADHLSRGVCGKQNFLFCGIEREGKGVEREMGLGLKRSTLSSTTSVTHFLQPRPFINWL